MVDASGQQRLRIGDSLRGSDSVRLESNAYLELQTASDLMRMFAPGTYELSTILGERQSAPGVATQVASRLVVMMAGTERGGSTVAGVRNDDAASATDIGTADAWGLLVEEGFAAFSRGEFGPARDLFREAVAFSSGLRADEARVYQAVAEVQLGSQIDAFRTIEPVQLLPGTSAYPLFVLTKSQLLYDSRAYEQALTFSDRVLRTNSRGGQLNEQTVDQLRFTQALSALRLGYEPAATTILLELSKSGMQGLSEEAHRILEELFVPEKRMINL